MCGKLFYNSLLTYYSTGVWGTKISPHVNPVFYLCVGVQKGDDLVDFLVQYLSICDDNKIINADKYKSTNLDLSC